MKLSSDLLPAYVAFLDRVIDDPARRPTLEKLQAEVESGKRVLARTRVQLGADDEITAAITVELIGEVWLLNELRILPGALPAEKAEGTSLMQEAVDQAQAEGATKIEARVSEKAKFDAYDAALEAAGFGRHGSRIEFEAAVDGLPDDIGTPLAWWAITERL